MGETKPLSFRIDSRKEQQLDQLSAVTDRPRSWHLEKALDAYLEAQSWQIEHIQSGIDQLDSKQFVAHDKVAKWLSTWGEEDEIDRPADRSK